MPTPATHKFQVELNGLKLPPEIVSSIQLAVNKAVIGELARVDLQGDYMVRWPKEWLGIWLDLSKARFGANTGRAQGGRPETGRPQA